MREQMLPLFIPLAMKSCYIDMPAFIVSHKKNLEAHNKTAFLFIWETLDREIDP